MKTLTKIVLSFIIVMYSISLIGCAGKNREPPKVEWLSVTKPPFKAVYVAQDHLDFIIVSKLLQHSGMHSYKDYKFNDNTSIIIDMNSHKSDTMTDSDTMSRSLEISRP